MQEGNQESQNGAVENASAGEITKELVVPSISTMFVYDTQGNVTYKFTKSRIVIEYRQNGTIAHVFRLPPSRVARGSSEENGRD